MFKIILRVITIACLTISGVSGAPLNDAGKYTHVISWGSWDGKFEKLPGVFLDGQSLGSIEDAYPKLNKLAVSSQDRIKIEIPPATDLHKPHRAIYWIGTFIKTWLGQKARIDFFQGDRAYKMHSVTWSAYLYPNGAWKKDLTTAHLILDNKDIGPIELGLRVLAGEQWDSNDMLLICLPYVDPPGAELVVPDELFPTAYRLRDARGIIFEDVSPVL